MSLKCAQTTTYHGEEIWLVQLHTCMHVRTYAGRQAGRQAHMHVQKYSIHAAFNLQPRQTDRKIFCFTALHRSLGLPNQWGQAPGAFVELLVDTEVCNEVWLVLTLHPHTMQ